MLLGGATFAGPIVARQFYDSFAAPMTMFFGLAFCGLGFLFHRALPSDGQHARPAVLPPEEDDTGRVVRHVHPRGHARRGQRPQ